MLNNPGTKKNCEKCVYGHFLNCIRGKCIHGSALKSAVGALEGAYWRTRKTYQFIDKIICISRFEESIIKKNRELSGKTCVLYNFSSIKKQEEISPQKPYVLYFGRYSEEKGFRTLVKACKKLPGIPFVFAGNGPLENQIDGVNNIVNKGFQTGNELQQLISNARFAVVPSEWYEPFGLTIVEAQSQGTPVLGAKIGAIPELVSDGKNGMLFESGNVDDLARKINELWVDEKKLAAFSDACRNMRLVTIDSYYDDIMRIYKD